MFEIVRNITTSPDFWEGAIGLGLILLILIKFKVLHLCLSVLFVVLEALCTFARVIYTQIILIIYSKKSDVDMSEYRQNIVFTPKGIKCTHITGQTEDVILIEHIGIAKPFIIFGMFVKKYRERIDNKFF